MSISVETGVAKKSACEKGRESARYSDGDWVCPHEENNKNKTACETSFLQRRKKHIKTLNTVDIKVQGQAVCVICASHIIPPNGPGPEVRLI